MIKEKRGIRLINRNITPILSLKLRRRVMYEGCKSKVCERGYWRTSHVGNGGVIIIKVLHRGRRAWGGARIHDLIFYYFLFLDK